MRHQVSIMACARWETQYITEWLLYHRAIGFDHVYLFCNDDDPAELFETVLPFIEGPQPFVTFRHFPLKGEQFHMYMRGLREWKDETEWLMFLDIDEFLCIRRNNNIKAFLRAIPPDWDCVQFNWLFFGNNGWEKRPGGSVLKTYVRRSEHLHSTCKTLTRTAAIDLQRINRKIYIWHDWVDSLSEGAKSVNVLGFPPSQVPVDGRFIASDQIAAQIYDRAVIHHYAFKSKEDFLLRYQRGIAGDFSGQAWWKDLFDRGGADAELELRNKVHDSTLADFWTAHLKNATDAIKILPTPPLANVALGKKADQSSHSAWSRGATRTEDALGAISGRITGDYQFHTDFEAEPWWLLDLEQPHRITEIRIFNRLDHPATAKRLGRLRIEVSINDDWKVLAIKPTEQPVGGIDGSPYRVISTVPVLARFVRLRMLQPGFLHLDQVEVYGEPAESPSLNA